MSGEKTTWRLYVMKPDADGLKEAAGARFSRVNGKYALIYSEKPVNGAEIGEKDLWRLNRQETEWLAACNVELLFEDAQKRQDEIRRSLAENVKRLEEELEKQLEKPEIV